MPRRSHAGAAVVAAVMIASVTACTSPSLPEIAPPAVSPPSVPVIPQLDTVRGLTFPTEEYRPTGAQQNLVVNAEEKLIAQCMSRYGFTWPARTVNAPPVNQVDRIYGVSDLETAQTYGYHLPPTDRRVESGKQTATASLSPSEVLVLRGSVTGGPAVETPGAYQGQPIPRGGCWAEALGRVTGVKEIDPTQLADSITVAMWKASMSDPRVVAVIEAWSVCMKQSGYSYPSPLQVGDEHTSFSQAAPISETEIRTAVADVRCKQSTNLIGIWFTIEAAYERGMIQQQLTELTEIKKRWVDAARNAAQILGVPAVEPTQR